MPERIQLRRIKGWRKPADAVVVARPTMWGNPCRHDDRATAVAMYRRWLHETGAGRDVLAEVWRLAGKDLACWCPLDGLCHADVLLELANTDRRTR